MVGLTNSKDERELAGKLRDLINDLIKDKTISYLRCVYTENNIDKKACAKVLEKYFDVEPPRFLAIPDIILVFEEPLTKEFRLVAIELKYFKFTKDEKERDKKFRRAFREIGQPLRYYIFGYDATILWHIFQSEFNDEDICPYTNLVKEVIEKLKLPMGYFSTKVLEDNKFRVYNLHIPYDYSLDRLIEWIKNVSNDIKNPLEDNQLSKRRRALKTALKIP